MHYEIPICKRCCFCLPLRIGILIWAYINLINSLLWFTISVLMLVSWIESWNRGMATDNPDFRLQTCKFGDSDEPEKPYIYIASSAMSFLITIIFTLTLIVAAHKKNIKWLRISYKFGIFCAIISILSLAGLLCTQPYVAYILSELALGVSKFLIFIYMELLVRAELKKLEKNHEFRFENIAADAEEE